MVAGVGTVAGFVAWLMRPTGADVGSPMTPTAGASRTTVATPVGTAGTTTTTTPTVASTAVRPTVAVTPEPPEVVIPVICRASWGALPVTGLFTRHEIERITIHHTAVVLQTNADAPGRVRQHQAYHQSLGWPDLAYHFIIDSRGNVYRGRPMIAVGDTATSYDPTGHLLICCEGNFDEQEIPEAQYRGLVDMVAWGAGRFDIGAGEIAGHRDFAATSCPGDDLYPLIAGGALAADVAAMGETRHTLLSLCGAVGEAVVAAIETGSQELAGT